MLKSQVPSMDPRRMLDVTFSHEAIGMSYFGFMLPVC